MKGRIFLLGMFLISHTFASAFSQNIVGKFDCDSREVGSSKHSHGIMTITKNKETYQVETQFDDGSFYKGTGIATPENQLLSVAFVNPKKIKETGIGVTHSQNGVLKVRWTYIDRSDFADSVCLKRPEEDKDAVQKKV